MSFPTASKHVRVLERAKLVRRRVAGWTHIVSLDAARLKQVAEWTEGYRRFWEGTYQRLDGRPRVELSEFFGELPHDPALRTHKNRTGHQNVDIYSNV